MQKLSERNSDHQPDGHVPTSDLNPQLVSVRDLSEEDIPHILQYWFHSPPGFIESFGVDVGKMPREEVMEKNLIEKCRINKLLSSSKLNALVVLYEEQTVGFHTINPLIEGDFGIFHAHIWAPKMRKRGLGMQSYPTACRTFMKRFDLQRILFKTPAQNVGAIRVKEKLGIRCIGEEIIGFGIIKDNTLAKVFELKNSEVGELK